MSRSSFKNNSMCKLFFYKSYLFNTYIYKGDLELNDLQGLICHKAQSTNLNVWFLCLMAYQPSWVVYRQTHTCRKQLWHYLNYISGVDKSDPNFP